MGHVFSVLLYHSKETQKIATSHTSKLISLYETDHMGSISAKTCDTFLRMGALLGSAHVMETVS